MIVRKKRILVVGASSGMGRELVRQLLLRECTVVAFSRHVEGLASLHASAVSSGQLSMLAGDVVRAESVAELVGRIGQCAEPLDGVFFATGVSRPDFIEKPDVERTLDTIRVNLEGAVRIFYAFLPMLLDRPGSFLAGFTSMSGDRGVPRAHGYSASKAGLDRLLESLRIDLWDRRVSVFTIIPGYVQTPMSGQNQFSMPGIWPVEKAVSHILKRMEKGDLVIRFPWYHSWPMLLLKLIPDRLYAWMMNRHKATIRILPRPEDSFSWE